jgi:hypothetical protein
MSGTTFTGLAVGAGSNIFIIKTNDSRDCPSGMHMEEH